MARSAAEGDLTHVAALLATRGAVPSLESLRARLEDGDGGILLSGDATLSWALDGGALHLYDIVGDMGQLDALLATADQIARARFAAVLTAALFQDDAALPLLLERGFMRDWTEAEVRDGAPITMFGVAREVA